MQAPALIDAALAAALTLVSAVPFLSALGFYGDDWALLAGFESGRGESLLAWDSVTFPGRPVQGLYLTLLYRAFGLEPLGYHLVNSAMLAVAAALLCTLLVRLGVGRAQSFATTVLFVLLAQLSTVRVWYASFQVPLSMALMLVSMHCMISFYRSGKAGWAGAAIVAAVLSLAAYEIFAPLLVGFAAQDRDDGGTPWRRLPTSSRAKEVRLARSRAARTTSSAMPWCRQWSRKASSSKYRPSSPLPGIKVPPGRADRCRLPKKAAPSSTPNVVDRG